MSFFELALQNLLSPVVLFFVLGTGAALVRSDLSIPEAVAKALALYLMLAIGFKGGAGMSSEPLSLQIILTLLAGVGLSFTIPVLAYGFLRLLSRLPEADKAAISGHYGSISIVTLIAVMEALKASQVSFEGYLIATAAVMELPAILSALWLARRARLTTEADDSFWKDIVLQGSVVLLAGAFVIGWITGEKGLQDISPFIVDPFKGVLCLFMLDMGLLAGRGLRSGLKDLSPGVLLFGFLMPLIGAICALPLTALIGLSTGGTTILMTLSASASYIAVPAAMRIALPQARPAIYLTLSLGVTFPFNLTFGIPLYLQLASLITS
jgi:hypothetical protein